MRGCNPLRRRLRLHHPRESLGSPTLEGRPLRSGGCTRRLVGSSCAGFPGRASAWRSGAYFVRMFVVTAAYHRYFSHRAFKTSRWFQFVLALGAQSAGAEGRALVGQPPPLAPQALRHRSGRPLGAAARLLVLARRLDPAPATGTRPTSRASTTSRGIPSCASSTAAASRCCPRSRWRWPSCCSAACHGFVWGFFVSTVLLWHGSFSINSLVAPVRPPALRDQRRLAQQLAARPAHHGRGLAQQPPPLPELGQPGLPLVGDRRHLLRAAPAGAAAAWSGTCDRPPAATRRVRARPPRRVSRAVGRLSE